MIIYLEYKDVVELLKINYTEKQQIQREKFLNAIRKHSNYIFKRKLKNIQSEINLISSINHYGKTLIYLVKLRLKYKKSVETESVFDLFQEYIDQLFYTIDDEIHHQYVKAYNYLIGQKKGFIPDILLAYIVFDKHKADNYLSHSIIADDFNLKLACDFIYDDWFVRDNEEYFFPRVVIKENRFIDIIKFDINHIRTKLIYPDLIIRAFKQKNYLKDTDIKKIEFLIDLDFFFQQIAIKEKKLDLYNYGSNQFKLQKLKKMLERRLKDKIAYDLSIKKLSGIILVFYESISHNAYFDFSNDQYVEVQNFLCDLFKSKENSQIFLVKLKKIKEKINNENRLSIVLSEYFSSIDGLKKETINSYFYRGEKEDHMKKIIKQNAYIFE